MGLPRDCAVGRSVSEELRAGWDSNEELLALNAELLDALNRNFLAANGVKRGQLPQPIKIRRPVQKPKRQATKDDLKRIFKGAIMTPKRET